MSQEEMNKLLRLAKKLAKKPLGAFATNTERELATIIATQVPALIQAANGGKLPSSKSSAKGKDAPKAGTGPVAAVG